MNVKILTKTVLNAEITEFTLEKSWNFQAGQFTAFCEPCQQKAKKIMHYFSIASSPLANTLELHIQNSPTHPLTHEFQNFLQETLTLELEAPQGEAVLTESMRPLLLVAGGSGFAPMKSIIETVRLTQQNRPIHLYWGVRQPDCLYLLDLIKIWQQSAVFQFTPVLSDASSASYRHGLVHEAALEDLQDLSAYDIYLAGPFPMSYAARDAFLEKGAKKNHLFSDAFLFA